MGKRFWQIVSRVTGIDMCEPPSDLVPPSTAFTEDLEEIAVRARAWAREMPRAHDLFLACERTTLMAANVMACRLGRGVSSCMLFSRGHYWMSGQVEDTTPKSVLVIAMRDSSEVEDAVEALRAENPHLEIDIGILFPMDGNAPVCEPHSADSKIASS